MTISVVCNDHDESFSICARNICNRKFPAKKKETGTRQTVQNNVTLLREHDYIAFDEYYNEPIGRSFGNCDIYNTTITWLRKHDHMARYFPIFLVFGAKFQYFDNGE